jgi:hypothetical protein
MVSSRWFKKKGLQDRAALKSQKAAVDGPQPRDGQ